MSSSKDTFEADTFAANTFASGTWRGLGVTVITKPDHKWLEAERPLKWLETERPLKWEESD